ncbi:MULTISPECIES: hypothetical protein [Lactobacillaceae]|jgi:hypothetical protein|uniref:hypothetical protein n=1 Tax=Lactobacillaceae TaxID=33958 RepID=UPI0006ACDCA1|nr:hypothetical protein [Lacticaseibacillus paracasei]MCP9306104.1 hypothetical protein [Lacticaseibacillus paracasei]MCP9311373.1 hypothetical protein [Lacticaseibacillus paracasei]MCP9380224.1 hypothetical protein [Lacticaseibacillus paracasei]OPH01991.1 hypothetical protein B4585_13075 [Lacticaseibacillus paracasei]
MTDISDEVDSNSSKVTVTKDHVKRLIKHLAEVGIPNTETMIAIGGQAYRILEANKDLIHESIEHIPHYSAQNRDNGKGGHWDTEKVHQLLQQI